MQTIKGVILAGGQSSRMGQDKALLSRDHRDMFSYTLEQLENLNLNGIVLSRNAQQTERLNSMPLIVDTHSELGPLGGIHAIVQQVKADAVLIVPVDMPLLTTSDLERLISAGRTFHLPVYFEQNYLPLFLPITTEVRTYLEEVVDGKNGDRSVRGLCNHFSGIPLAPLNKEHLVNTNTPQQWQLVKQQLTTN